MKIENNKIVDKRKVGRLLQVYRKSDRVWIDEIKYIPIEYKNLIIRGNKQKSQILKDNGYNANDYYFIEDGDIFEIRVMDLEIFEKYANTTQVIQIK